MQGEFLSSASSSTVRLAFSTCWLNVKISPFKIHEKRQFSLTPTPTSEVCIYPHPPLKYTLTVTCVRLKAWGCWLTAEVCRTECSLLRGNSTSSLHRYTADPNRQYTIVNSANKNGCLSCVSGLTIAGTRCFSSFLEGGLINPEQMSCLCAKFIMTLKPFRPPPPTAAAPPPLISFMNSALLMLWHSKKKKKKFASFWWLLRCDWCAQRGTANFPVRGI